MDRLETQRRVKGQVLVIFALSSFVIAGFMALALDVGFLMSERRETQSAADAAALAGAYAMLLGETNATIASDAFDYAAANDVNTNDATIQVTTTGDRWSGQVEVTILQPVQRFFLGAVYTGPWEVSATAVANIDDVREAEYALIALDCPGIGVNGSMFIDVIDGSVMSNCDIFDFADGTGSNILLTDGTLDAGGVITPAEGWYAPEGMWGSRPPINDPLAGATPPHGLETIEADAVPDCFHVDACTLVPGNYTDLGTIRVKGTMTLLPGAYYFSGTSIVLQDSNSRIEGDGVMLYFDGPTNNTFFDPKTGAVHLTAPAVAPYTGWPEGVVLWIANCSRFDSQGNEEFYLEGVFYAPCSAVTLHGNPYGEAVNGQVIVGNLDVRGTSDLIVRYNSYFSTPRIQVYLTE